MHRRDRPKKPFRDAFQHAGGSESASEAAALVAAGPGWFKPEPLRLAPPVSKIAPPAAAKIDRLLLGSAGGEAEARIRIGAGALAGAEIRLTATPGSQAVTAQLLTPTAGSRQTLFVAMEEIRLRLRDKGIALASSVARQGANSDHPGENGHDGRRDPPRGGEPCDGPGGFGAVGGFGSPDRWQGGR